MTRVQVAAPKKEEKSLSDSSEFSLKACYWVIMCGAHTLMRRSLSETGEDILIMCEVSHMNTQIQKFCKRCSKMKDEKKLKCTFYSIKSKTVFIVEVSHMVLIPAVC